MSKNSGIVSYLNGKLGACVRACAWYFRHMGRIDTLRRLHVTGSVNRWAQLNVVSVRSSVTVQWSNVQTSNSATHWGKLQRRRLKCWCRCMEGKPRAENWFTNGSNVFAKGGKLLKMSHVQVGRRQPEPQNYRQCATNAGTRSANYEDWLRRNRALAYGELHHQWWFG